MHLSQRNRRDGRRAPDTLPFLCYSFNFLWRGFSRVYLQLFFGSLDPLDNRAAAMGDAQGTPTLPALASHLAESPFKLVRNALSSFAKGLDAEEI